MKNPILLQKPTSDHCGPGYVGKSKYLETKNLLSEFDTEEKRLTVLRNLGILNNQIDVVLELGDDTHAVMSQKAVTEAINNNKNIEIYESENNLPTSAATGRIAAVVYQTNNETVNRLYFKNEEAWKSINDVKIVDAEDKLDPSAPLGTIAIVAINKLQKFLSDLNCPRDLKTAEDFELLEFIEEPLVINAPTHVDIDLSEELITLTFAQDFYIPLQTNSTDILPNLPHYIYIGKFDTLTSDGAAWGIYHFSQALGGGIIAEYDSNGDRISYNERQIQDLNLYLKYQYRYKYWVSKKTIPNYDIVNTFIAVGQTVMTTVPYIKDFDKWTSLLNTDILYIDEAKLYEYEVEQDGTSFLVRVPKDRLKEITRGVDFIDFKNYSRICVGDNIYPLFLEDGMYTTPIRTLIEEDYALQIWPMIISGFSDSYTFLSGYAKTELAGITIANDYSDLSSDEKVGSIATTQESVDDTKTVSEYYELIQGNFPTRLREVVIDPKEYTDVRVEGYHLLEMYVYNVSIDGKPISLASPLGKLIISEFSPNYSSENTAWGIYCHVSTNSYSVILEYDHNGNRITWNPDALTAFNNSKKVSNTGGKVYGGYISTFDPYLSVLDGILYFSNTTTRTTLYLKHGFNGWEKYYSPIKNSSIKLEHLSDEVTKTLKGINIYDSENSLPVNSEAGNIATVSNIKTEEIEVEDKFSVMDIYVEENPDCEPLMELKITVPETWPSEELPLIFGPKGYNNIKELVHGRYLGLVLTEGTIATVVFENGSPILNESPLIIDLSIVEETLTQVNEIISSWRGVVCYGVPGEGSAPSVTAPTEAQIEAIDLFIGYNNGTHIETTETHVNDIYFKETTGWRKINDVKIVDSVDDLDKNAPQGSLASVVVNTFGEISFNELYQPTEEDFDLYLPPIHKFSRVNGISVIVPDPSIEPPEFEIALYSEDFNPENGVGSVVILMPGIATLISMADDSQNMEFELLIYNEDENTLTLNEENLAELNNILSEKVYVYGGTYGQNEDGERVLIDPSVSDFIYRVISGIQKTELYIKNVDGWKVVGDGELKAKVDNLEDTVNNFEDKTDLIVNSVDELPEDAPIGTLASVLDVIVDHPDVSKSIIPTSEFVPTEDIIYGIPVGPYTPYISEHVSVSTCSAELETKEGYVLRIHTAMPGTGISLQVACTITSPNGSNKMVYLVAYDTSGNALMSSIGTGISEFVDLLEQGAIVTGSFDNIAHIFPELIVKKGVKKAHLYVKNGLGWEQYDGNQSVTTEKVADEAIVFDKLSVDIQKVLSFAIQHFGLIIFKDKKIETICLTNWDTNGDGFLTKEEVSTVTNISKVFSGNTEIVSFDELSNFTNLTAIPLEAFANCTRLTSITIPESVTSIGDWAFSGCRSLTSITIPESVTSIGEFAFYDLDKLTSVRSYATTPPTIRSNTFLSTPTTIVIYVPDASVDAYKAEWSGYASQIKPMSEYVES